MNKTFCDICKKDITGEHSGYIKVNRQFNLVIWDLTKKDYNFVLCDKCYDKICKFIEELKAND